MSKTILFSPVGGTDPISAYNLRDGSMLHICRVYKPDIVYLYMSAEILEKHRRDDPYVYCIKQLSKRLEHEFDVRIIERPELVEVQEFDYFYNDFRNLIMGIYEQMDEQDQLLLNVSSGTPAMKSALLVINTLGEFPFRAIQSATPEKAMNKKVDVGNYTKEELWESDIDNVECDIRCKEIECPALLVIKNEEHIKKQLTVYDYRAAYDVADALPEVYSRRYKQLLLMAAKRALLEFGEVDKLVKATGYDCVPVKSSEARKYFEYALVLDIKVKRGEYVDFIRGITPIIVDLFEIILRYSLNIDIGDYCTEGANGEKIWDQKKLQSTDIEKILMARYGGKFRYGPVYSDSLACIIIDGTDDIKLRELVEDLRNVEKSVRNLAAHQIVSITDDRIKALSGFSSSSIMKKLKKLFLYTRLGIKEIYWDSYEDINRYIYSVIDKNEV